MTWKCLRCGIGNDDRIDRCSFCGTAKPANNQAFNEKVKENVGKHLTNSIHNAVDKLPRNSQLRLWRWMEDNVL